MPLVFAGACSHAPGITGRAHLADPAARDELYRHFHRLRDALEASRPDALVVVAAEHFANFFFDNMPAYCVGMADFYEGPIEYEAVAAATKGATGELWFYAPIPIIAVGCTVATMGV